MHFSLLLGITIEAIECLIQHEISHTEENIHKELVEFKKQYDSQAFGQLKKEFDQLQKETNQKAQDCDTALEILHSKVHTLEQALIATENQSLADKKEYEARIKDLEEKTAESSRKCSELEKKISNLPKSIEDTISSGTFTFVSSSAFEIDEPPVEPPVRPLQPILTSTPSTSISSISPTGNASSEGNACNAKRSASDSVTNVRKRIKLKWSWKKCNPEGLAFLEKKASLPNFSRCSDFKEAVYTEGIRNGLWAKGSEYFLKVCTKIDNMSKKL